MQYNTILRYPTGTMVVVEVVVDFAGKKNMIVKYGARAFRFKCNNFFSKRLGQF